MSKSKQAYRNELGIIKDIMYTIRDSGVQGIIISAISRRANLSHYAVLEKTKKLIDAELIETFYVDKNRIFTIREKGIKFCNYMEELDDNLKKFGLGDSIYRT